MTKHSKAPAVRRALLLCTAFFTAPALADHMGPSGVGSGGGMSVFSPDTLDAGHWAAGLRLTTTRPEQRSDAELAALAGQHVHAHNTDYNLNAALGAAYGVNHHLTVSVELPYVRRDNLREGTHAHGGGVAVNGVEELGSVAGIGEMSLLAKYRLSESRGPGLALIAGIKLPTGSTHQRSLDGERLETEHQPGTGSWDPILGASASASLGAVTLTASALYQFSGRGAQHTRLGDRRQGGIALSHRFGAAPHEHGPSHNHHHGDELDEHGAEPRRASWDAYVEIAGEWEGRQKVDGEVEAESGGKWAYVAPGLRYSAASGWSASAALALPAWQRIRASHPDNRYRLMLSLGRAF
jgi:Putative MetA-pathway of phenol degradation